MTLNHDVAHVHPCIIQVPRVPDTLKIIHAQDESSIFPKDEVVWIIEVTM
jgi:hypothetical protein